MLAAACGGFVLEVFCEMIVGDSSSSEALPTGLGVAGFLLLVLAVPPAIDLLGKDK